MPEHPIDESPVADTSVAPEAGAPVKNEPGADQPRTDAPEMDAPSAAVSAATEPPAADQRLLDAHDLARNALIEITAATSIGAVVGHVVEGEHVLSLLFECTLPGYPGWHWTVTLARVSEESDPVVLEAELLPGEQALLAPDWVPWSERLAEYQAAQEAARAAGLETDGDASSDADADEEDDDGDDDFGDDDLDGIDIELHDSGADEDEIDLESDDITGVESAALDAGTSEEHVLDLGVDESDDAESDADEGRGHDPA